MREKQEKSLSPNLFAVQVLFLSLVTLARKANSVTLLLTDHKVVPDIGKVWCKSQTR